MKFSVPSVFLRALRVPPKQGRTRHGGFSGGSDPALDGFNSETVLVGNAVENVMREGTTAIDFLRGRKAYRCTGGIRPSRGAGR